jgi:hypothetical protein
MGKKKHLGKIVVDKHIDGDALGALIGRKPINAAMTRPTRQYRGDFADDEDFSQVLMLAWQNEAVLLSADGEMIKKALKFSRQYPKNESCLRGVVIIPPSKKDQIAVLRAFISGNTQVIANAKGGFVPKSFDEIEDYNFGLDLRKTAVRVVNLCDCED